MKTIKLFAALSLIIPATASALAIDTDGDTLSDLWETQFGFAIAPNSLPPDAPGDPDDRPLEPGETWGVDGPPTESGYERRIFPIQHPKADPDRDNLSNWQEMSAGTDPWNFSSTMRLWLEPEPTASELWIYLETVYGRRYVIESSFNRQSWTPIGAEILGNDSVIAAVTDLPSEPGVPVFFRYRLAGEIDADGDGLTAWEERALGLDDTDDDSDDDGMPDGWEIAHGLNPKLNDAAGNPDDDGLPNLEEYLRGTDPVVANAPAPGNFKITANPDGSLDFAWEDTRDDEETYFIKLRRNDGTVKTWTLPPNTTSLHVPADQR